MTPRLTRRHVGMGVIALLIAAASLVNVTITEPRVHVRWRGDVTPEQRTALERRYSLRVGRPVAGTTWRYELLDRSRENVGGLVRDPAVLDTGYIDRSTLTVPDREIHVTAARARALIGPTPFQLLQPQSLVLFAAGALMLLVAQAGEPRRRRIVAIATLLGVGVAAFALPLGQRISMGDSETYTTSRESFELFSGVRQIRYEAHLAHAVLGRLDHVFGANESSPGRALRTLMHGATVWAVASALALGTLEGWSPIVVRYLGLAILAPAMLLYFGYQELGHLSLNLAAFPLFARGLEQADARLEAGSTLFGLGAAFHGFGLLSLAGALLSTLAAPRLVPDRLRLMMRVAVWGAAAYLGWVAIYLIVLKLPLVPGHAESIPLRPWRVDEVGRRLNAAILTGRGARDLFFTAWVVGMPLLAVAGSLWRRYPKEVRTALVYAIPATVFTIVFWPIQGLAVEMDLLFAAFPAVYALAWVCAHDARRTAVAAALLVAGHLAFWRVVLDSAFVNSPIG